MRRAQLPRPLVAVLAAVVVQALAWTFAVPALQGADESGHVAYVQKIADAHEIPWTRGQVLQSDFGPAVSTEQRIAWLWAGLEPLRGNLAARPLWSEVDERMYEARARELGADARTDGLGNPSFRNPPLYYLVAAAPYALAGGSFFDRVWAMRLANLPLVLAVVWMTWLIAGEVFGRRRVLQTVAAVVVGMQPVLLDVDTRVTPDALLAALGAAALYLMVLVVRRGPAPRLVAGLLLTTAAACLTHGRAIGLLLPVAGALAWGAWRGGARRRPLPRLAVLAVGAVALAGLAAYAGRFTMTGVLGFFSYLWQFYLPALPGMDPPPGRSWGVEEVYLERLWGTFVQFEVRFPGSLQTAVRLALWLGLAAAAVAAWRHRRALRARGEAAAVLLAAGVLEILALHAAAFRSLVVNPADPVLTGRYLLVVAPLIGIGAAAALSALSGRARPVAAGVVVAGSFLLALSALGLVVERFYA